jgi:benzoylformate decarboxylase
VGDPKSGLAEIGELLRQGQTRDDGTRAEQRLRNWTDRRHAETAQLVTEIQSEADARPLSPLTFMNALARVLPPDVAVVEEAPTTHHNVFERLAVLNDPYGFFAQRGWALGWGIGCALGVKLAWPDRPVLALIGDGAACYGIQGLWSAALHGIPVTFVIAANAQYKILKVCGEVMNLPNMNDPRCPGLDLVNPAVDFVGLARAFGVEAERLAEPDALSDDVRAALSSGKPRLIEVPIAP